MPVKFDVTILGSNSANFAHKRFPSAQIISFNNTKFLVDCGEGTQYRLVRYRVKINRINCIFISHLHGDHFFGLIGLLSTMHLNGRKNDLKIFGPPGLEDIIKIQLKYSDTNLCYPIVFHVNPDCVSTIYSDSEISVENIILDHGIPCSGFLIKENPGSVENADNKDNNNRDTRSYAYCSDTKMTYSFIDQIRGVNLLYHEATFLHDKLERALATFHTTAKQAGLVASKANAKKLIIGHFSSRYKDLQAHLKEAESEFENVHLAKEGITFVV